MATKFYQGKDGSFKIGSTATASIESWNMTITTDTEGFRFFDDSGWSTPIPVGQSWGGSVTGRLYLADENQLDILGTVVSGTATGVSNLRLYINSTIYFAPNTTLDPDATAIFTNFAIDNSAGTIIAFTSDFTGVGPVEVVGE